MAVLPTAAAGARRPARNRAAEKRDELPPSHLPHPVLDRASPRLACGLSGCEVTPETRRCRFHELMHAGGFRRGRWTSGNAILARHLLHPSASNIVLFAAASPFVPPGRRPRNPVDNERGAVTQTNIVRLGGSRDSVALAAPSLDPKHRGKRLSSPPASTVIGFPQRSSGEEKGRKERNAARCCAGA